MAIHDVVQQLSNYKGVLGWTGDIEIDLYIKNHPIAIRRPKTTEMFLVQQVDTTSGQDTAFKGIFYGTPDPLELQLDGWLITPISAGQFDTIYGNYSYAETIGMFLSGELNSGVRRDPDYYISPYGHKYNNPVITIWDPKYTPTMRKQEFSMGLLLEK